jgi:hypothetical protein
MGTYTPRAVDAFNADNVESITNNLVTLIDSAALFFKK